MLSRIRGTPGTNLKAPVAKTTYSEGIDFGPTAVFHEKFPNVGKPFIFEEQDWLTLGDGDGYQEYFERKGRVKNSVKWGQLKLFTSELQFFNKYWNPEEVPNPTCVYVGSAPGTHIAFLADMFPWFEFHLYDPRDVFDEQLKKNPKIKLFVKLFENSDVKKYVGRKDIFLISDIRSTAYNMDKSFIDREKLERENEELVVRDMMLQKSWVEEIQPVKAHLKFRLPYSYAWQKNTDFTYFDGDVYRQVWAPQTSTETRLVPDMKALPRKWNSKMYEKMMFYHNNVIREHAVFVNPLNDLNQPIDLELGLTQDYDSTVFAFTVRDYLIKFGADYDEKAVLNVCRTILDNIGKNVITLDGIRAGIKGRLSPSKEEAIRRKLREMGEDDDE